MGKNKKTFFKYGLITLIFLMLNGTAGVYIGGMTYSEGERTGVITKFSHKGLGIKTWEGELQINVPNTVSSEKWLFSVSDSDIVKQVQEAQRNGGRWTLKYRQQVFEQSWKGATTYFIVGLEKQEQ